MGFEFSVALRFLREGRFQSLLIIVGVAAGVAVVAYISALVTGLQTNTLNKTLGAQAHIVVSPPDERVTPAWPVPSDAAHAVDTQARAQRLRTIANWPAVDAALSQRPGISAVSPMTSGAALARRGEATRAIVVTGVELARYDRIVGLRAGQIVFDGKPSELTSEILTTIYGEEDWDTTPEPADEEDEPSQVALAPTSAAPTSAAKAHHDARPLTQVASGGAL